MLILLLNLIEDTQDADVLLNGLNGLDVLMRCVDEM